MEDNIGVRAIDDPRKYRAIRGAFDSGNEEVGAPQFSLAPDQGETRQYQPDIVLLGGCWGVKLGQIVMTFRE